MQEGVGDVFGLDEEVKGEGVASEDTGVLRFALGLGVHGMGNIIRRGYGMIVGIQITRLLGY